MVPFFFDSVFYVITDCADIEHTCVAESYAADAKLVQIDAEAGQTFYPVVDGFMGDSGKLTLTVGKL